MRPRIDPFEKRRKELARKERQREKAERREIRDREKAERPAVPGEDPDIAGIVPGPQPTPDVVESDQPRSRAAIRLTPAPQRVANQAQKPRPSTATATS